MIDAARRYLDGQCSIQELNGYASKCATAAHLFSGHPGIKQTAVEWMTVIYSRWNEFGDAPRPLSEQEFRDWLQSQLLPVSDADSM